MKKFAICSVAIVLMAMAGCGPSHMAVGKPPNSLDALTLDAPFIFKGKVVLLHANVTDERDVSDEGVVTVSDVIAAPGALSRMSGEQVTVRFLDINTMKVGEERLFFTDPYWLGESMGVREKGSVGKDDNLYTNVAIGSLINQARERQNDTLLKKALNTAKLVIAGTVVGITTEEGWRIGSEHDPEWKLAQVKVDETLKGGTGDKIVQVLFASSRDIMYFRWSRLNVGDEGVFLIQQADSLTIRMTHHNNVIKGPSGFIRGTESIRHIRDLIAHN